MTTHARWICCFAASLLLLSGLSCAGPEEVPDPPPPVAKPTPAPTPRPAPKPEPPPAPEEPPPPACPEGMVYVETDYCTEVRDTCLEKTSMGYPRGCVEFSKDRQCVGEMRHLRFCIDAHEYPNTPGEYPPVVLDAFDASAMCREQGKRLCWESEWTAACEGAQRTPFPYGYKRDPNTCNIDNKPRNFDPKAMRSSNKAVQDAELNKITQHHPIGADPECKSDFGVYNMTGNVEEWIFLERPRGACTWAGTKGGHWLKVRNACRPTGVAHNEPWTFYVLSLRCCSDPDPEALKPYTPDAGAPALWTPPKAPVVPAPDGRVDRGWVKGK